MKVLNLYAGLGGNRRLWGDVEVTAVEMEPEIAKFYADQYPQDTVIVGDAHQYLLDHYSEFDFIWASPPCPTHSRARFWSSKGGKCELQYPDMKLYQEILFLQHYFEGNWAVENVVPFYDPIMKPSIKIGRHLFWSSFHIPQGNFEDADIKDGNIKDWQEIHGIDISGYKFQSRRDKVLRNCVNPDLGLHVFSSATEKNPITINQISLL